MKSMILLPLPFVLTSLSAAYAECIPTGDYVITIDCTTSVGEQLYFEGQRPSYVNVNEGVSIGGSEVGVTIAGHDMKITVGGRIDGSQHGIALQQVEGPDQYGGELRQKLRVDIQNGAVVSGNEVAVQVFEDPQIDSQTEFTIINSGLITSSTTGVDLGLNSGVDNAGQINSNSHAVVGDYRSFVSNSGGVIESFSGDAVRTNRGAAYNSGHIKALNGAAIRATGVHYDPKYRYSSTVSNFETGVIEGDIGVDFSVSDETRVFNYGNITGHGGTAVRMSSGHDVFNMWGGSLSGSVDMGAGDDEMWFGTGLVYYASGEYADGGVLDGGDGDDYMYLGIYRDSVYDLYYEDNVLNMKSYAYYGNTFHIRIAGFETIEFYDMVFNPDYGATSPVPLPAGAVLLASVLGLGIGLRRRRRLNG